MGQITQILSRWQYVVVPVAVFVAFLLISLWLRRLAYRGLERWGKRTVWPGHEILVGATKAPSLLLCLILGLFLAIEVSIIQDTGKTLIGHTLWSLFILVVAIAAIGVARGLIHIYLGKLQITPHALSLSSNMATISISIVFFLMVLDIWGVPTSPVVLLIGVVAGVTLLALRDTISSLFAGFQLTTSGQIKVGDYIKLDSGDEGYVTELNWRNARLEALDTSVIIVPNSKLAQSKITNYGRPLKQASEPFRFYTRLHLNELTNFKAKNLQELVEVLKKVSESVTYYHTHHFLEEHHYLTPEPPNDFAVWVEDALGNEALGERLASLDTFEFANLGALKERIIDIIEEYLSRAPDSREALPGREFHFMRSVSVIQPLPYVAHDLREFTEILRNVSLGSLYFHVFESRLRLGKGSNDFSTWLEDSLREPELASKIAELDPYNYTLEGLRSLLIQLIEKRIK